MAFFTSQASERVETILPAGQPAPDFTLPSADGSQVSLGQFRGRPVILAFYPADWSPVCGDQLTLYNEVLPMFEAYNAQLLGISVDSVWSHRAYTEQRNLQFALLADFEPKGAVAWSYGVYNPEKGNNRRSLFVVDSDGIIRWSYLAPGGANPGADGILNALEALPS